MPPLKILLADDHQMFRQGVRALLERENFNVVGEASDGHEAVRLAHDLHPDVVVLDYAMPFLNGLDAARAIGHSLQRTRTVLLSMHTEDTYVLEALRVGVGGYVVKTQAAPELVQAIRAVSRGQVYLSPKVSRALVDAYLAQSDVPADPLTLRERQVLQLVAEGKRTKEIALLLAMSVKTAETHRARIMAKLGIHDTAGLVRYAIRHGAIEL
jgi:two-component system response regulator NreC